MTDTIGLTGLAIASAKYCFSDTGVQIAMIDTSNKTHRHQLPALHTVCRCSAFLVGAGWDELAPTTFYRSRGHFND